MDRDYSWRGHHPQRLLPPLDLLNLNKFLLDFVFELGEQDLLYFDNNTTHINLLQKAGKVKLLLPFLRCEYVFFQNVIIHRLDLVKESAFAFLRQKFPDPRNRTALQQILHEICQVQRADDAVVIAVVKSECRVVLLNIIAVYYRMHNGHKLRQVNPLHHFSERK